MLDDRQQAQYLQRIGHSGGTAISLPTLQALHNLHMLKVPFENLDISLGRKIDLTEDALFDKIVLQRRGGFCYELNHLFFAFLSSRGFDVQMLSARVYNGRAFGKAFDHMLLLVNLQGVSFIADAGFGDSFREPLALQGEPSHQVDANYKIEQQGSDYVLFQQKQNAGYQAQYKFDLAAYGIDAFQPMCVYQQTSPDSSFTQKTVCSIATEDGRKTISNSRFIITSVDRRSEQGIAGEAEYRQILRQHFQIDLPQDSRLDRLLAANNTA
ncbi:MAG: arylamine N-acetyltransferase [Pseudomonadota bacterium]